MVRRPPYSRAVSLLPSAKSYARIKPVTFLPLPLQERPGSQAYGFFLRMQRFRRCQPKGLSPTPVAVFRCATLRGPHGRLAIPQDKRLNAASISFCSHGSRRYTPHCPIGLHSVAGGSPKPPSTSLRPIGSALSCSCGIHIATPGRKVFSLCLRSCSCHTSTVLRASCPCRSLHSNSTLDVTPLWGKATAFHALSTIPLP